MGICIDFLPFKRETPFVYSVCFPAYQFPWEKGSAFEETKLVSQGQILFSE